TSATASSRLEFRGRGQALRSLTTSATASSVSRPRASAPKSHDFGYSFQPSVFFHFLLSHLATVHEYVSGACLKHSWCAHSLVTTFSQVLSHVLALVSTAST